MATTEKKVKRAVIHPRYYAKVDKGLKHIPVGTVIEVPESVAEKNKAKLGDPQGTQVLKGGQLIDQSSDAMPADVQKALAAMQKQLDESNAAREAAEAEVAKLKKAATKK